MKRTWTTKRFWAALIAGAGLAGTAAAQVQWVANSETADINNASSNTLFLDDGPTATPFERLIDIDGTTFHHDGFNWKANFTLLLNQTEGDVVYLYGARRFTVGRLPVQWTTTLLTADGFDLAGKLVNGGGDESNPVTAWNFQAWVEDNDPFAMIVQGTQTDPLANMMLGNDLRLIGAEQLSGTRFLMAHGDYWLTFRASIPLSTTALLDQLPLTALTGEFDTTRFGGFDVGGLWIAVPEPSSLVLLALGGVGLLRRRRPV